MKGIILAGGSGTRLHPMTQVISKQMLPIYDKPMIYYPLSVLMLAGIRDVLLISTPNDLGGYEKLLGDGSRYGININYEVQDKPNGLAEAFIIGENFIGDDNVCLILGDNVFYGQGLVESVNRIDYEEFDNKAVIFGYHVGNPSEFGVVEFDELGKVISLEEKPEHPKSNYAIPGLYFYDNSVIEIAKNIKPSDRGELEITSINNEYLRRRQLQVKILGRGTAWLDTGTCKGLLDAANYVEAIQTRQGLFIACLEEIAYRQEYISKEKMLDYIKEMKKTEYGKYLEKILNEVG